LAAGTKPKANILPMVGSSTKFIASGVEEDVHGEETEIRGARLQA
jgi:hypothetical protein